MYMQESFSRREDESRLSLPSLLERLTLRAADLEPHGTFFNGAPERAFLYGELLSESPYLSAELLGVYLQEPNPLLRERMLLENASEGERQHIAEASRALYLLEAMVLSDQDFTEYRNGFLIEQVEARFDEARAGLYDVLPNAPAYLVSKLVPVRAYFNFLQERGKARQENFFAYIASTYGWPSSFESQDYRKWDDSLFFLNTIWRAYVLGYISQDEFTSFVHEL